MNFKLDSEQQMLQDSVRRFIDNEYGFGTRTKLVNSMQGGSNENWQAFANNGWLAAALPEEHGGIGGTIVETVLIAHEFGRGLVVEPYLGCAVLAAQTLVSAATDAQQASLLPGLADGSSRIALAYSEAASRGDPSIVDTTATRVAGGFVLQGCKTLVLGATQADRLIVSAKLLDEAGKAQGISLFLLDARADGVALRPYALHDGSWAAGLTLDQVRISDKALLGEAGRGLVALESGLSHAIAALCAEQVGAMEKAIEMTADYLKVRHQFGVPIGTFQALQHRIADMAAELELARSMLYALLTSIVNDTDQDRRHVSSQAKAFIGRAARVVSGQAIQLHGGIGMTDECAIGHYFKRAIVADVLFGNSDWHEAKCATALKKTLRSTAFAA
jgi:alkylation response protein AidB-like acyl-CoA dehydrogenase